MRRLSLLVLAAALTACASGPGELTEADQALIDDADLAFVGTDDLAFDPDAATAPAGELTIALTCEQGVNHNLVIGEDIVVTCGRGETAAGTVDLPAGDHEYVCTVPGHSQRMRGTLTVG